MKTHAGIAASPGIRIGPSFVYEVRELRVPRREVEDPEAEWRRLERAIEGAQDQLADLFERVKAASDEKHAEIFRAHVSMLRDPELLGAVRELIEGRGSNAEAALHDAAEEYAERLERVESEVIRARAADLRDVKNRVLANLQGVDRSVAADLNEPSIILADDLTPSDTALMAESLVLGFCLVRGTRTSHAAILARGMGLPAVVATGREILSIEEGETLILDGSAGKLIVDPDPGTLERYERERDRYQSLLVQAQERAHEGAVTADGVRKEVAANIGDVKEARRAKDAGAEGVGLLRTEFLFLGRSELPDEEEQFRAYRSILDVFEDRSVILRTLDLGGDKELPYLEFPEEENPFLGVRGIRYALRHEDLLRTQLRAALRAAEGRSLKIMFPMVATVAELRRARTLLDSCRAELEVEEGQKVGQPEVGVMVEVPAAAMMVDHLAGLADFFSIGSNDLGQYVMAADRTNPGVASLATGLHPPLLRLIGRVIDDAHRHRRWVGLCGEMAGDPLTIPILLGLGLDEFSMAPSRIALAKQHIRSLNAGEMQLLAREVLEMETAEQVEEYVRSKVMDSTDQI